MGNTALVIGFVSKDELTKAHAKQEEQQRKNQEVLQKFNDIQSKTKHLEGILQIYLNDSRLQELRSQLTQQMTIKTF